MRAYGRLFGLEVLWFLIWIVVLGLIALLTISSVSNQPLERVNWLSLFVGLGSVFDARVARRDSERGLLELTFDGGTLLASDRALGAGAPGADGRTPDAS